MLRRFYSRGPNVHQRYQEILEMAGENLQNTLNISAQINLYPDAFNVILNIHRYTSLDIFI